MKTKHTGSAALISALIVFCGAGCNPGSSSPAASVLESAGYTAFAISDGSRSDGYYSVTIQMRDQGCTLWSDAGPWKPAGMSGRTASMFIRLPTGRQVSWKCQTPDGKSFTELQVDGKSYDLDDGGLFLIVTRGGPIRVIQLKTASYKVSDLESLAKQFPEVAQFLERKTAPLPDFAAPHPQTRR